MNSHSNESTKVQTLGAIYKYYKTPWIRCYSSWLRSEWMLFATGKASGTGSVAPVWLDSRAIPPDAKSGRGSGLPLVCNHTWRNSTRSRENFRVAIINALCALSLGFAAHWTSQWSSRNLQLSIFDQGAGNGHSFSFLPRLRTSNPTKQPQTTEWWHSNSGKAFLLRSLSKSALKLISSLC